MYNTTYTYVYEACIRSCLFIYGVFEDADLSSVYIATIVLILWVYIC
jgi:hypothetical protein